RRAGRPPSTLQSSTIPSLLPPSGFARCEQPLFNSTWGLQLGSNPLALSTVRAAGVVRKAISVLPASGALALTGTPAENCVVFCSSAGSGPTISTPPAAISSEICCTPISASPLPTSVPARPPSPPHG